MRNQLRRQSSIGAQIELESGMSCARLTVCLTWMKVV